MRTRTIKRDEALAIARREESHFFDRKALKLDGKKTQKIGVAFANADGGEFYIGIADDKDAPRVYPLIQASVKRVHEMMSAVSIWTTEGLKTLKYPPEVIWEVIVNALIHRDYSISDDTQILIYDNRIEVLSPGRLPGYVKIENILEARFARNPKIVRTLNRYKDPPNKDLGEGLNTTFQKMKEWGLKAPEIREDGGYVKVVLPHVPLAAPTEAILRFLKSNSSISNKQACDTTGIKSENLVKIEFYKLRDEKYLERVPGLEGPKSAWRLTPSGRKKAALLG